MNIESYFKGKDYLENKEAKLFTLIDELDRESFSIFSIELLNLAKSKNTKSLKLIKKYE